jgi:DNA-binding NarL/FixJ family response regulator
MAGLSMTCVLLLIEDNAADVEHVKTMLESVSNLSDFQILTAPTLAAAKITLATTKVDVVLLDLCLPDGEGIECVRAVLEVAEKAPLVVLTGRDDETLGQACIDAGAEDYLTKDELKPSHLRRAIGFAVARKREALLRELQTVLANYRLLSSDGVVTSITARLAGVGLIRDAHPDVFGEILRAYITLFKSYLEQISYKKAKPKALMERIVTAIGDHGGGPRDLLDVHVAALEEAVDGASVERARAAVVDGRLIALEMMGLLVDFYRVGNRRLYAVGGIG